MFGVQEKLLQRAEYVWDDQDLARRWMNKPHSELKHQSPLQVAQTETGAQQVEALLDALFYGLPV